MRQIIAEGLKEIYFQDGDGRAMGLSDVTPRHRQPRPRLLTAPDGGRGTACCD
ncbi:hypothetical protein ACFZCU_47590 [Streptomyces canus]|uniref:hypothetical protein n=1 Tax=Streptomyces canus TaxID=58343 RepID=UPI0036E86160